MSEDKTYLGYVNIKNDTIFTIGKFAILWNVFEEYNCKCNCNYDTIKTAVRKMYKNDIMPFERFAVSLESRSKKARCSIEEYVQTKLFPDDVRARIGNTERNIGMNAVLDFVESKGLRNKEGALYAILRIRNNMFHGLKGHAELDDQVELFEAMCGVLEEMN